MQEIFVDVCGYENYFQISNFGRLYSKRSNKILKQHLNRQGYATVSTRIGGRNGYAVLFRVHRLVADAFVLKASNSSEVNHIDGNKANNHVSNLEWVTPSENVQHAWDTGLRERKTGVDNPLSKLSAKDISLIRTSEKSCRELAEIYKVHHTQISRVKRGKSYADVAQ